MKTNLDSVACAPSVATAAGDHSSHAPATVAGVFAIIFWATSIAFVRIVSESLGPLRTGACGNLAGGAILIALLMFRRDGIRKLLQLPGRYLLACSSLFAFYSICFVLAIGLASGRQQVIEVGLINYLWPAATLLLSIPVLRHRAKPLLVVGIVLALGGIALAIIARGEFAWETFQKNLRTNSVPYLLAFACMLSWALFSVLVRRWGGNAQGGAVPLFLLVSGTVMFVASLLSPMQAHWSWRVGVDLAVVIVFPTTLAYVFWDWAMRKGNVILVASLSYFIPVLSTLVSSIYLQVAVGPAVWTACALVAAGAYICKLSIRKGEPAVSPDKTKAKREA